jgi:hypothetical protein
MSNSSSGLGKFLNFLIDLLRALFSGSKPATGGTMEPQPAPAVTVPADNTTEPARIVTSRVLLIVYDPVMNPASGQKLSQMMNWKRVEDLVNGFIADIQETSGGLARYQIIQRIDVNEFPAKTDGFRYDPASYMAVLRGGAPYQPEMVDYQAILTGFNVLPRVANREIDEGWVFAFPHAGFYESTMGGAGTFWFNAPPLAGTAGCDRKFVLMGFSYERGVGEMLESFGHRCESILTRTFECTQGEANLYQRFTRYNQIAPGKAEVGNIRFAPNSERDYDWNNPRQVLSNCYDWYNFPSFKNDIRQVNADEWGNGDIRAHHVWWLKHLPKVAGRTNGIASNWWQYVMDTNYI